MFGASALAYNQLQAAAAHKIDPSEPGLKALFPIVGPGEFHKGVGFPNGVLREQLVAGWLRGQIFDTDDDLMSIDHSYHNNIHTSYDYQTEDKFEAANKAIDHFVSVQYGTSTPGYYPNSIGRTDMDISKAPVNELGESDPNGQFSRYGNMEVPVFYVAGWYDIFVDACIETFDLHRANVDPALGNDDLIKIVIGPWAHQTISGRTTGDVTYPQNVTDITKIDITDLDLDELDVGQIAQSDLIGWFRYNLNNNAMANVGEPKVFIPEATEYQMPFGPNSLEVRFPTRDYIIPFVELLNFITGADGLKKLPISINSPLGELELEIDLPALGGLFDIENPTLLEGIPVEDFTQIAPVRYYVIGPIDDPDNEGIGNYWSESDKFPITDGIEWQKLFLHRSGVLNHMAPSIDEGRSIYVHDPDDPIYAIGGANMIMKTPQGDRDSQGQFNYADSRYAPYTMDRPGVLQFETEPFEDTVTMVGFSKAKLYASSHPENTVDGDPTDADFFVRILDVYPDGREMFVVEGSVNARAREYARSISEFNENPNAEFSNIEAGKVYEYFFDLLPIAYTFGVGHRIKILISSSNHPRYQANACVPIEPGEFFRRQPNDGLSYLFEGVEYEPRVSVQRLAFSDEFPSQIILPIAGGTGIVTPVEENLVENDKLHVFPNPTNGEFYLAFETQFESEVVIRNMMGQEVYRTKMNDWEAIDIGHLPSGQYNIEVKSNSLEKPVFSIIHKF